LSFAEVGRTLDAIPLAVDSFLPNPAAIKRALRGALKDADKLDMAVAFVGRDWSEILGGFKGATRLVCWLSSTNTDPRAVEQMMARRFCKVRQLDAMHAKVYLPRSPASVAIVGSANLSARALADEGTSLQFEAALLVRQQSIVREASEWFEARWEQARPVTKANLAAAKESWDAAREGGALGRRTPMDASEAERAAASIITARKFLTELAGRPRGATLAAVARSILAAASEEGLDVRWRPRGFTLYSEEVPNGVGLLGVARRMRDKPVHVGVRRWMTAAKNKRVDKLVDEVMRTGLERQSPEGNSHGFHLEELHGKEKGLVVGLAAIARA
jgi:HKD family nuclease